MPACWGSTTRWAGSR